jgi:asparagine synthase (glutamine-hydrolysing)
MGSIFGLAGTNDLPVEAAVKKMAELARALGNDVEDKYSAAGIGMGVRSNESRTDGVLTRKGTSYAAVIEGEIYNCKELRRMVGSENDTEHPYTVIFSLYERYGRDFPKYLNGVFCIALWDCKRRILYLVRDHLGSHSCYYSCHNDHILFATSMKSLINTGLVDCEISRSSMNMYLCSTAICPPYTMFNSIKSLRPGSIVEYRDGKAEDHTYWHINEVHEDRSRGMEELAESVRALILDSIKIRAEYGGHYGSLVSGGIDTSVITASLSGLLPGQAKLPVFSIAFEEQSYSDSPLQKIMYERYPLEEHTAILTAKQFGELLPKAVGSLDTPVNDVAMVGMYLAFQMARRSGCDVIFDGEAADELFYTGHAHAEREFQTYAAIPSWIRTLLLGKLFRGMPIGSSYRKKFTRLLFRMGLPDNERRLIGLPTFYKHATPIMLAGKNEDMQDPLFMGKKYLAETATKDPLNIYYYGLLKTFLPEDLLYKNERMAAANGIINRTPFVDFRLVELAFQIPQALKIRRPTSTDDGTKLVYKKAIEGLIPEEIRSRKKTRGFSQPSAVWYRDQLKGLVGDLLLGPETRCVSYLDKQYISKLYNEHIRQQANFDYLLNSLLVLELWLREFGTVRKAH